MSVALGSDQVQIRDMVRRLALEQVAPRADGVIDRDAAHPQDMFDLLRRQGLFALPFPVEHGGAGSLLSASLSPSRNSAALATTPRIFWSAQWAPFAHPAGGTAAQQQRWLPCAGSG